MLSVCPPHAQPSEKRLTGLERDRVRDVYVFWHGFYQECDLSFLRRRRHGLAARALVWDTKPGGFWFWSILTLRYLSLPPLPFQNCKQPKLEENLAPELFSPEPFTCLVFLFLLQSQLAEFQCQPIERKGTCWLSEGETSDRINLEAMKLRGGKSAALMLLLWSQAAWE